MENLSQAKKKKKKQIANLLASTISNNFSSQHYSQKNVKPLKCKKTKTVKFTLDNTEEYNQPFSLLKLRQTLQKSNDSAVGPDDIYYRLLTNLPERFANTAAGCF